MNLKVLRPEDIDQIEAFEKSKLSESDLGEVERELFSWKAPWRREALEHYIPNGWCFAAWQGEEGQSELMGYFLAQVQLFCRGMTQTMWLEHLSVSSPEVGAALTDLIYRLSREKHIQKLVGPSTNEIMELFSDHRPTILENQLFEIKTAKIK